MTPYPVQLEVSSPPHFERIQLVIRLAIAVGLGWLGIEMGWVAGLLFIALPVIAAVLISSRGPGFYLQTSATKLWRALTWLLSFSAYMLLLTDDVPVDEQRLVRAELHTTGQPAIGSSLLRLVTSIPSAFVLCFVGFVSSLLCLVAVVTILVSRTVPPSILSFQAGYLRWQARLLAYHASLVEEYPPFALHDRPASTPASMVNP
jgi:hypothetical protein